MSKGILEAIGLWWERLHVFSDDTVQHAGVLSRWTRDLLPTGETEVQPGELVELHVTIPPDLALPAPSPAVRLDILEFDWLFWSGTDDPLESLRTPGAADPVGDFLMRECSLVERPYSDAEATLEAVIKGYQASRPSDFDTGVLVVRDTRNGWKDVIAWWRVPVVDDSEPRAYFVAELPGPDPDHVVRDGSSVPLRVARSAAAGASVRVHGTIVDSVVDAGEAAQPVPQAKVTLGRRSTTSTAAGGYVIDARLGVGDAPLTVARPGIDSRTYTVRTTVRGDGGIDIAVLDEQGAVRATASVAAGADPALAMVRLDVSALVHRVSGTAVWPDTRIVTVPPAAPIGLAGRFVCALRLESGPMLPRVPATSREWDAIRSRTDVLRSARPGRPGRREATGDDGRYELSFVDLRHDAHYLIWVETTDPRDAARRVTDAIVRTIPTPDMRRMDFVGTVLTPERHHRRAAVSTRLLEGGVQAALDVVKVIDTAAVGAPPALQLLRARPSNVNGIDAVPPVDVDQLPVVAAARRVVNVVIEVLPLVPVFEPPERRSPDAAIAALALETALDGRYPRGYLLNKLRWILDARRAAATNWDDPATCTVLERTLLTHPSLGPNQIHDPNWGWWRADAISAADFAFVDQWPNAIFANRRLAAEYVPILTGPVPRLLGLFGRRHLHFSPGHGVYAVPAASRHYETDRGVWAGYSPAIENYGGEEENAVGIAACARQIAEPNGVRTTVSRETDPTVPGLEQRAGGVFASVNPAVAADHNHPRLWQQNAYYWLAAVYDLAPGPLGQLVRNNVAGNTYAEGINRKVTLFEHQAADPGQPVDVFVAFHTNGGGPAARGYLALYLDIRPGPASPAPGAGAYVEDNQQGLLFAQRLIAELAAATEFRNAGVTTYFQNNNPVKELALTTSHFRTGGAPLNATGPVQVVRSRVAGAGLQQIVFPTPGGRTIPVGYIEFGFHSSADDAAALAQGWFRRALGLAIARACEGDLRQRADALTGDDVVALLQSLFGDVPAVAGLRGGAAPLGAAAVSAAGAAAAITAVTGRPSAVVAPTLEGVVTAIELAAAAGTRHEAVRRIATALAPRAGFAVADLDVDVAHPLPAPADDAATARRAAVANAVVRPLISALGATIPADAVPAMAHLPLGDRPLRRADAAAMLAAALGIRPGDLATVTRPINGVTVLAPTGGAEAPDARVPESAIDAAGTAIGRLRLVDTYRLLRARATDARGNDLPAPLAAGAHVYLTVETGGTAWRVQATDVHFVLRRAGQSDIALACAIRRDDAFVTELWQVPPNPGAAEFSLIATIEHPVDGEQQLQPLRFSFTEQGQP